MNRFDKAALPSNSMAKRPSFPDIFNTFLTRGDDGLFTFILIAGPGLYFEGRGDTASEAFLHVAELFMRWERGIPLDPPQPHAA